MIWEYRVMARGDELAIYEVYYYEDGRIQGYTSAPAIPAGDTIDALRHNCELYLAALAKPVLQYLEDE